MSVRLLTSLAGADFAYTAGEVFPCDEATARRLIAAGYAEPLDVVQAQVVQAPEAAVRFKPKGRGPARER